VTVSAASGEGPRTVLLMLPSRKQMFPLSTVALAQAQTSRSELEDGYRDAYVLDSDGIIRRIEHIEVLGPFGESMFRKLVSRLSNGWRISTRLSEPVEWDGKRLKALVLKCLGADGTLDEEAELAKAFADVKHATSPGRGFCSVASAAST